MVRASIEYCDCPPHLLTAMTTIMAPPLLQYLVSCRDPTSVGIIPVPLLRSIHDPFRSGCASDRCFARHRSRLRIETGAVGSHAGRGGPQPGKIAGTGEPDRSLRR